MNQIIDFLNNIKIGEPISFKNMSVFPVTFKIINKIRFFGIYCSSIKIC